MGTRQVRRVLKASGWRNVCKWYWALSPTARVRHGSEINKRTLHFIQSPPMKDPERCSIERSLRYRIVLAAQVVVSHLSTISISERTANFVLKLSTIRKK